jgi:hypothetical protein
MAEVNPLDPKPLEYETPPEPPPRPPVNLAWVVILAMWIVPILVLLALLAFRAVVAALR